MNVEHFYAGSTEEIQDAITKCDVIATGFSVKKWSIPSLTTDIFDLSSNQQLLTDFVPFGIDPERTSRLKASCESNIAEIEARNPEFREGKQLGILTTRRNGSVFAFSPNDQTVTVSAGISVRRLNQFLADSGQCIPLLPFRPKEGRFLSCAFSSDHIDQQIYLNLPHVLQSQCGSWRDWVLGMKVVLANGTVVEVGSKVVKNVAGFDLHKLLIGSFATLGVISEVTLRTFPLRNLPEPNILFFERWENPTGEKMSMVSWIQRVPLSELSQAIEATKPYVREVDLNTGTLWGLAPVNVEISKPTNGWIMGRNNADKNVEIGNPYQIALMKRAKQIFDPTSKLNPGVFGFI